MINCFVLGCFVFFPSMSQTALLLSSICHRFPLDCCLHEGNISTNCENYLYPTGANDKKLVDNLNKSSTEIL